MSFVAKSATLGLASGLPLAAFGQTSVPQDTAYHLETATGTISGTLQLPQTDGIPPIALIIAGSGATDRNGNAPGLALNMYLKVAAALAATGVATVRYDKRGIGLSSAAAPNEADLRFDDYVADAVAWVKKLRADGRFRNVGIIGHSEGALIGMLTAQRSVVDAYVSLEGGSLTLLDTTRRQLKESGQLTPYPKLAAAADAILDAFSAGKSVPELEIPPELMALFRPSVQPYVLSENVYQPRTEIAKLRVRTTIVQGSHDIQVTVDDGHALAAALPTATFALLENMTHVLTDDPGTTLAEQVRGAYVDATRPLNAQLIPTLAKALA